MSGNGCRTKRWPGAICHAVCVILLTCILCVGLGHVGTAEAQTASFRSVDTNADGVLSFDELVAAFGTAGARKLLQDIDRNADNRITIMELRGGRDNGKDSQDNRGTRETDAGNRGERENEDGDDGERDRDDGGHDDRDDGDDDDKDDD